MTETQSTLRAALWMGGSIASFLTMTVAGRAIMPDLDVFQVMEMRSVIGWFILLPLVLASGGFAAMRTKRPLQHIGRNVVHYAGQFAWLQALTMIPLAQQPQHVGRGEQPGDHVGRDQGRHGVVDP